MYEGWVAFGFRVSLSLWQHWEYNQADVLNNSELLSQFADRIVAVRRPHPIRVAIDGVDAAGKTSLANELVGFIETHNRPVIRASIDGFHNPASIRHQRGPASPEGYYHDSFNYQALIELLLVPLGPDGTRRHRTRVFDYRTDAPIQAGTMTADENAVLLFDGVFLLRPELREHWDFSIFIDAPFELTLARAMQRDQYLFGDADAVRRRYEERYIPGQKIYLEECRPREIATAVVRPDQR